MDRKTAISQLVEVVETSKHFDHTIDVNQAKPDVFTVTSENATEPHLSVVVTAFDLYIFDIGEGGQDFQSIALSDIADIYYYNMADDVEQDDENLTDEMGVVRIEHTNGDVTDLN